jgi:hypothetical protein
MQAFQAIRANTIKGIETLVPQPVPPGTSEAGVATMEEYIVDLPSREYFLKTLDRPHYPGEDENGNPPWTSAYRRTSPQKLERPKLEVSASAATMPTLP